MEGEAKKIREALNRSHEGATGFCGMRCPKGDNANGCDLAAVCGRPRRRKRGQASLIPLGGGPSGNAWGRTSLHSLAS